MKALFNAILDGLTFTDLAGKRRPRTYVALTQVILILLITLASCAALERETMMDEVQGTPIPVTVTLEEATATPPTPTTSEACPADSAGWSFLDIAPKDNFKRIEPACVYENLGKSVAWALAAREGYTRAEATQALGFAEFPLRRQSEVIALTDTQGPLSMPVSFTPTHTAFAEWRVDGSGQPAIAYALRGCFRTSTVVGNRADSWNKDYPVICTLSEDSTGPQIVFQLNGHTFTSTAQPTRSFALFGYAGDGNWTWLGTQQEPKVALETLPHFSEEAQSSAQRHNLPVWDAAWLAGKHGLPAKPLPEGWQGMTNEADKQAILAGLNAFLNEAQP